MAFGQYATSVFPGAPPLLLAVGVVWLVSIVQLTGVRHSSTFQLISTVLKVLLIVAFPVISLGSTHDAPAVWWTGFVAFVLAGLLPVATRYLDHSQDRARDVAAASAAWERAKELIRDDHHRLVLLDELNIVLRYDYLAVADVLKFLREEKPADKHVVITGRNAHADLIELADLVTEMTLVKHPFRSGIKAQKGIEF